LSSDRRAAEAVAAAAAAVVVAVVVDRRKTDPAIPTRVPIRLLTSLLRLLQAMAQIHMLNVRLLSDTEAHGFPPH
jgi:UDP-N-acetylmuramyl pentapeptide synthase